MMLCSALACEKHDKNEAKSPELKLTAQFFPLNSEFGDLWGRSVGTGIFMTGNGSQHVIGDNGNIRYDGKLAAGSIGLEPAVTGINLPDSGILVDIIGYYPYCPDLTLKEGAYLYEVNVVDQNSLEPDVLMHGIESGRNSLVNEVHLQLKPVFAKINARLIYKANTRSAIEDVNLSIDGISCKAEIDVLTGAYVSYAAAASTQMKEKKGTESGYEAVVLAQELSEQANITVKITGGQDAKVPLMDLTEIIERNRSYDILVEISPDNVKATLVDISDFYISDWKEDDTINGSADNNQLIK